MLQNTIYFCSKFSGYWVTVLCFVQYLQRWQSYRLQLLFISCKVFRKAELKCFDKSGISYLFFASSLLLFTWNSTFKVNLCHFQKVDFKCVQL